LKSSFQLIFALLLATAITASADASATSKSKKKHKRAKPTVVSTDIVHFNQWKNVTEFIDLMVTRHGFDRTQLETTFDQARYLERSIQLIKPAPPGKPKNWKAYRARFVESVRIEAGIAFWDEHAEALERAEKQFGVPAEIIVGLIGVETIYGRNTGNFRVVDALTTLAFAYPETPTRLARMDFFRSELENILLLSRDFSLDPFSYKGSYAGAIGLSQFMPSSIRSYAIDFDNDGKIDLQASAEDAIGSIANYLALHGWKKGLPTAFPATLINPGADPEKFADMLSTILSQGLKASYTFEELKLLATTASQDAPQHLLYGLVDLQNGDEPTEYWLATEDFFALTQYNRSYFYAMSVIDLGKVIAQARVK
jgi:membrane-bound lytic murein transglycosylase B